MCAAQVIAQNAHRNFHRGAKGDHGALMAVFRDWAEADFSSQWCVENYVQVRHSVANFQLVALCSHSVANFPLVAL